VRIHLIDAPNVSLPSIEGILMRRVGREYLLAVPEVHWAAGGQPDRLEHLVAIPRERVAFFEVLR
jgi:hypothetical protein